MKASRAHAKVAPMTDVLSDERLYEDDFPVWLERQAAALRARGAGGNAIDYDNVAEELDGLARKERNRIRSLAARTVEHLLKLEFVASPRDQPHWRSEVLSFRDQIEQHLTASLLNGVRPELSRIFGLQLQRLVVAEYLTQAEAEIVSTERPDGYTWEEITREDWYPAYRWAEAA